VGAMELFGNRMIGGAVEGQRALSAEELLYSHMTEQERRVYAAAQQELQQLCRELRAIGSSVEECE